MPVDILDFLRPSPEPVVTYYVRQVGRAALPPTSPALKDPAVRLYASALARITLCFKYWDADWRQLVPVSPRGMRSLGVLDALG